MAATSAIGAEAELALTKDKLAATEKTLAATQKELAAVKEELALLKEDGRARKPASTPTTAGVEAASSSAAPTAATTPVPIGLDEAASTDPVVLELPDASYLSPRGRFTAKLTSRCLVLTGKSSSMTVPYASLRRLWCLPDGASRTALFAAHLSAPAACGKLNISALCLVTKPGEKPLALSAKMPSGAELKLEGSMADVLAKLLPALNPSLAVSGLGTFKPAGGAAALQCYHKAAEAAAYGLDDELLVKEGSKVLALPYERLRAELLPPSGRRTFDMQLETSAAGSSPAVTIELTMIPAEEFPRVLSHLKRFGVNVNGCKDERKPKAAGSGPSKAGDDDGDESDASDDSDDDDDDDFDGGMMDDDDDDDDDEDFKPDENEDEPEEEFNERGGLKVDADGELQEGGADDDDSDDSEAGDFDDEDEDDGTDQAAKRQRAE